MIDNNLKIELLNEKSCQIEQKRQRLFTIVLLLPLIYFLLNNSVIEEIDFSFFSIKQIKVILLFFPTIYALLFLYIAALSNYNSKLIDQINFLATGETEPLRQHQKEPWIKYLQPVNILGDILGSIRAGGLLGCSGAFLVFIPLLLSAILYPFMAYVYSLIMNFRHLNQEYHNIALANIIFSIWVVIAMLIYSKSIK